MPIQKVKVQILAYRKIFFNFFSGRPVCIFPHSFLKTQIFFIEVKNRFYGAVFQGRRCDIFLEK